MTTRKPKTNNFNNNPRPANVSDLRKRIEEFAIDNPGPHNADQIAEAVGGDPKDVRRKLAHMVTDHCIVNNNPGKAVGAYQHFSHWQRAQRVDRRDPITNAGQPNGSTEYWRAHMARFNEPPRVTR